MSHGSRCCRRRGDKGSRASVDGQRAIAGGAGEARTPGAGQGWWDVRLWCACAIGTRVGRAGASPCMRSALSGRVGSLPALKLKAQRAAPPRCCSPSGHVRSPLLLEGGIVHAAARGIIASLRGRLLHAAAQRRYGLCPETQHPVGDVWVRLDGGAPTRAGARGSACGELVLVRGSSGTLQRLHTRRGRDHSYLADACVGSCHRGRPRRARASMASADETRRPSGSLLAWMLVRGCLDERSAVDLCWPRGGRSERDYCCSRRSAAHRVGPSWCPQRAWCGGDLLGRRREMVGFRPGGENGDGGGFRAQALRAWWEASSVPGGLSPGGRRSLSLVAMSARPCVHRPCMPPRGTQRS